MLCKVCKKEVLILPSEKKTGACIACAPEAEPLESPATPVNPAHRESNIGYSNYSQYSIQVWDIWREYNLNPWDADIVKRVLRTKREYGLTEDEARILDYEKIKHICDERISQLKKQRNIKWQ